jgi:3-oxoacyl-[acyl-carrier-protein] synthase II
MPLEEVVITGIGVVSPIGIGRPLFWEALCAGRSGVGPITFFNPEGLPVRIAAEVKDFDPRAYVKQRKSLKVMSRDAQMGIAASVLACRDAGIEDASVDPERFGVILGADRISNPVEDSEGPYRNCIVDGRFDFSRWATAGMAAAFPLGFLKVLPNMIASHVSITHDARGPNNTIHHADVSGLLAVMEAARVIQRGAADVMLAGGASSQMTPFDWSCHYAIRQLSHRQGNPAEVLRPFDADRDGEVCGEGAGTFILESRRHAEARGAKILARVVGCASASEPRNGNSLHGNGLKRAIAVAMAEAAVGPAQIGHVNAHGTSTIPADELEAQVLHACVPNVPVTAPKSYFGNLGAAGGAIEMAASVLAIVEGRVPATLNYQKPDPKCPVEVIATEPLESAQAAALVINWTPAGQAAVVVLAAAE